MPAMPRNTCQRTACTEMRDLPFTLDAWDTNDAHTQLECIESLRYLPGRRWVLRARMQGRDVAAKLFIGVRAQRDYRREKAGMATLAGAGVQVPTIVAEGRFEGGFWLAFEWLVGVDPPGALVGALVDLTARLHAGGVLQTDPHRGNFITTAGGLVAVDGGRILQTRMTHRRSMSNLADLLARCDASPQTVEDSYRRYCSARGWAFEPRGLVLLSRHIRRVQRRHTRRYLKKTLRRCSMFEVERHADFDAIYARVAGCPELAQLISSPEAAINDGVALERGDTSTAARVAIGDKRYVVERYSAKRRRARRAWLNGHRLHLDGVQNAMPIALLRPRGNKPAYLVLPDER